MHIDLKCTVWERIHLTKEGEARVRKLIKKYGKDLDGVSIMDRLDPEDYESEVLYDTSEFMTPVENGNFRTVEAFEKTGEYTPFWHNGTSEEYPVN